MFSSNRSRCPNSSPGPSQKRPTLPFIFECLVKIPNSTKLFTESARNRDALLPNSTSRRTRTIYSPTRDSANFKNVSIGVIDSRARRDISRTREYLVADGRYRSYRSMRVAQWYPLIVVVLALGSDKNSRAKGRVKCTNGITRGLSGWPRRCFQE